MAKPQQIFVGCPFGNAIRKNYDRLKRDVEKSTPLHIVLADTTAVSSTDYLLEHITTLIRESAGCIFDVTGGNPNVSLEVGIAHALPQISCSPSIPEKHQALRRRPLRSKAKQNLSFPIFKDEIESSTSSMSPCTTRLRTDISDLFRTISVG